MPQALEIVHAWEGWLSFNYYNQAFQRTNTLQMGGAPGDQERIYVKFDLTGLPKHVDRALIYLMPYASQYTTVPFGVCQNTSSWDLSMTWSTQPTYGTCYGYYSAPTPNSWAGFWVSGGGIEDWYSSWTSGSTPNADNYGVMLFPQAANNNFDPFYSTLYYTHSVTPPDQYAYSRRPILQLDFTPTLELKMPLPGLGLQGPEKISWLVTTEIGGYDCLGHVPDGSNDPWPDPYHTDEHSPGNYFSIDFSWKNMFFNGTPVYSETDNIPVLAAADGVAQTFPLHSSKEVKANGNFVVITHGSTGFETRYLHLASILVADGAFVTQGTVLGYMGSTGKSKGKHLHFGVRYNGQGYSYIPQLAKVLMEGLLLKSYQTECAVDPTTGIPTKKIFYYPSTNAEVQ